MRVALGTIEVSDETAKKIRKAAGKSGRATRGEVKEYFLTAIDEDIVPNIGAARDELEVEQAEEPETPGTDDLQDQEYDRVPSI